jgi:hypothetical protein
MSAYNVSDNYSCIADQFVVYANRCDAVTNTWGGNVSAAWENPLNWSCGNVPDPTTDVIIDHGSPYKPVINSNVTVKSLTAKNGVNVVVSPGFKLELTGQ